MSIYADEEEQKDMAICHPECIKILKNFIASVKNHSTHRALDAAGGDGRLSKDLLVGLYSRVDLFDKCPEAIKRAKKALNDNPAFGYAEKAPM